MAACGQGLAKVCAAALMRPAPLLCASALLLQ
eukprot:COSAG04_NODE_28177_length_277_cov_0.853933_2_plen_31_part_01